MQIAVEVTAISPLSAINAFGRALTTALVPHMRNLPRHRHLPHIIITGLSVVHDQANGQTKIARHRRAHHKGLSSARRRSASVAFEPYAVGETRQAQPFLSTHKMPICIFLSPFYRRCAGARVERNVLKLVVNQRSPFACYATSS